VPVPTFALLLFTSCAATENSASILPLANTGHLQQRPSSLAHQLAGLQQQNSHQQQYALPDSSLVSVLQAAYPVESMQEYAERPIVLGRTTTNAGAVLLRTLSTRNPRVLTLAAAAAKAAHGTPQHAAVLEALKNEIMQATGKGSAVPTDASFAAADAACHAATHSPTMSMRPPAAQSAAAAEQELTLQLQQQQPLTQDALWAALMAKAAARTGPSGSDLSSPQLQQQQPSPKPLPGHGSADSGLEIEGTSCALPWALLQAAQQAQQEEDEKEAAAAAAAAAAATAVDASAADADAAEAAPAAAASASACAMEVDAAEASTKPPKKNKSCSGSLMPGNSTVVFKRRNLSNSNALQKHFSKPAPHQPAMQSIARTMSEVPSVPKPQHTFKKQIKKKPLVMCGSSSNLAILQQLTRQQQQQQQGTSPGVYAAEPECSAETGATAAAGFYMTQATVDNGPTISNVSLRAPAVTAPAAIGTGGVIDVIGLLESREKQLQLLQEQLHMQRCRMVPPLATGMPQQALSGLSGGGPWSPVYSNNTAAAISELQRLLGSMAATAGPNSAAAAAAAAAGVAGLQPSADAYEDVHMSDHAAAGHDAVGAAAALLAQARRRPPQQQQQQQYQAAQQYAQQEPAPVASAPTLATIKALAAALGANQQQQVLQLPATPAAAAPGYAGIAAGTADLLRKLAGALQPRG
jgi:hypothetical protein